MWKFSMSFHFLIAKNHLLADTILESYSWQVRRDFNFKDFDHEGVNADQVWNSLRCATQYFVKG